MINNTVYGVYLCSPTNSTMFTECCDVAICNDQQKCPGCGSLIYGHDTNSEHWRGVKRWKMAYKPSR